MILTLDVENTVTKRENKLHLDPFEPTNTLTMVGLLDETGHEVILTFDHSEKQGTPDDHAFLQRTLNKTKLLIAHNVPHDLLWLWESGFTYDGKVFDTMIAEYILQRGQKEPLSLEACAERYQLDTKKQETLKEYFKKGYNTRDIPLSELSSYLSADLSATQQLYNKLISRIEGTTLQKTIDLSNQLSIHLARIYQRGFKVDLNALDKVQKEFENERQDLLNSLEEHTRELMGDRPINLNSPEQLSWVIYSRKPKDKKNWSELFSFNDNFKTTVNRNTNVLYKQKAKQCPTCKGIGQIRKVKKDGTSFKRTNRCRCCDGCGYTFMDTNVLAGLKFSAPNQKFISANGFSTGKDSLTILETIARVKNMPEAEKFLRNMKRLNAIEVYLSSFVNGISVHTKPDGMLHARLLQHRTGTGRLSGADPNMQNMPRGGTFPVKKVFVSRWEGGNIMEADFAQLEFRVAAFLSQDKVAMEEVKTGFDVHSYTAKTITHAGQPITRQQAKEHTFAPLFGATGYNRTPAERQYYINFMEKYSGIAAWHKRLASEVLTTNCITTPSGRTFTFPNVRRNRYGVVTYFTQIKNYPVQSFATADIVPICLMYIDNLLLTNNMKSCIVNTVHDSVVIDVHPKEKEKVLKVIKRTNDRLPYIVDKTWNIKFNVPLLLEAKIGPNWLDTVDVA
ncbi:MAG: hypothetical protein CBC83_02240 [Flavobacteriales bacterium TMED123]|nr:hypothetical protein [Candidatus Neomarinimicrobiota bacterium]OUV75578.1 MAG: hypothetical protein CBC83_02240 [Flavobacteriales bacterium TMED123]